jgi:8-oxo-dGTP pyrophosphatase MutT (NUDIX family)
VPAAVPAATVALLRPSAAAPDTLETFLLRRPGRGAFPGAHVFPGGRVDTTDADPRWRDQCDGGDWLAARLDQYLPADLVLAHAVAAVREVFEETGVLLAQGRKALAPGVQQQGRADLLATTAGFLEWCVAHDIRPSLAALQPWAHWITPENERHRFDAWFFLAAAPPDQHASACGSETVEGGWMTIDGTLEALDRREVFLAPPTLRTLEELRAVRGVDEASRLARARTLEGVMPRPLAGAPHPTLVLPVDPEYGEPEPCGIAGPSRFVLRDGRWWSEAG